MVRRVEESSFLPAELCGVKSSIRSSSSFAAVLATANTATLETAGSCKGNFPWEAYKSQAGKQLPCTIWHGGRPETKALV